MSLPIRIQLPQNFLKEETICGFRVTEKRKKIWAVELDLVQRFVDVCRKYDIHYSMYWGSILGAVRHKGFIPWDDDFDFIVDRENFNKLLKIPQAEFKYPYFLQTALSDRSRFCPYARFRNSETTAIISGCETRDYNNGIYIDVYVFDGVVSSMIWARLHNYIKHITIAPLLALTGEKYRFIRPFAKLLPYKVWWWIYSRSVALYTPFTDRIGAAYSFKMVDHLQYWTTKDDFTNTINLDFEFMCLPAINNYLRFLRSRYGDYMEFPPLDERGKWHDGQIEFEPDVPYAEFLKRH